MNQYFLQSCLKVVRSWILPMVMNELPESPPQIFKLGHESQIYRVRFFWYNQLECYSQWKNVSEYLKQVIHQKYHHRYRVYMEVLMI